MMNIQYHLRQLFRRSRAFVRQSAPSKPERVVPITHHDLCENPIFVFGAKRSGTSLTRRILNAHFAIACPAETYFLNHFAALLFDSQTAAGLKGFGIGDAERTAEIRRWASIYHEGFRRSQSKPRWADKTPEYLEIAEPLEILFGPRAQYILVFRHPISVTQSVAYRRLSSGEYSSDPLVDAAHYVANAVARLIAHRAQHPKKCFSLYYEDLMRSPEMTLRTLFQFLNETWDETVLRFNDSPHSTGSEDPIVRGTRGFEPHFYDPNALTTTQQRSVIPILKDAMLQLGYTPNGSFPIKPID